MSENRELRILAIGAHPDDIEFGCGAILLQAAAEGAEVHLAVCSKGEAGTNGCPEQRVEECQAAAQMLGASLEFLDCGGDSKIESSRSNALLLARVIRQQQPAIVLAPSLVGNQHPDHCAVGRAARDGARLARYAGLEELGAEAAHAIASLFFYAVTPGAEPSGATPLVIDVTRFLEDWERLMACHQSQMKTRRYVELQLARARALGLQAGGEYAQALWSEDPLLLEGLNSAPRGVRLF